MGAAGGYIPDAPPGYLKASKCNFGVVISSKKMRFQAQQRVACLHLHHPLGVIRLDRSLVGSFSKVTLNDKNKDAESWILRKYDGSEEELYVYGHTVVWSRGLNVISTFTVGSPINQVVWCSFVIDGEDPHLHDLSSDDQNSEKNSIEGFAAISDGSLHVFSRGGDDYLTSLPFQVRKLWKCAYGLIFERKSSQRNSSSAGLNNIGDSNAPSDTALATVFCLQHPLREFAPVVKKTQSNVRYMNRSQETIVFCDENLIMTFDSKHGVHAVWKIRKINQEDVSALENNLNQQQQVQNQVSSIRQMSITSPGTSPMCTSFRSPTASMLPNIAGNAGNIHVGLARTPLAKNPSFVHLSHTPNSHNICSPAAVPITCTNHAFSPLRNSSHLIRSPSTPISHESLCLNDTVHEAAEPLRPEICIDHVWSESFHGGRESMDIGAATRVFLTEDVCGQKFLAYYIDSLQQLRVVRYSLANDMSQFIFGVVASFPARDAAPLKDSQMISVLDVGGNIILLTGNVKMAKLYVTGVPALSLSLSHGLRNVTPSLGIPQPVSTPAHPSRPGSVLGNIEEVDLLSPVPELTVTGDTNMSLRATDEYRFTTDGHMSSSVVGIAHAVGSELYLEVSNGSYYKTEVPQLCSTGLVRTCLEALCNVLPIDAYLQVTSKWYGLRHCPGALASYQSEWALFEMCLKELIGYSDLSHRRANKANQAESDFPVSPVVAPKKARHAERGDAMDWEYILQSSHHEKMSNLVPPLGISVDDEDANTKGCKFKPQFESLVGSNERSSLDHSTERVSSEVNLATSIFCALHVVYEEQKLNIMNWENVSIMGAFLQLLASDIGLCKFSRSYMMDNPDLLRFVPIKDEGYDPQHFRLPYCFSNDLEPNIFANLDFLVNKGSCLSPIPIISGVTNRTAQILTIYDFLFNLSCNSPLTVSLGPFVKSSAFKKERSFEKEDVDLRKAELSRSMPSRAQEALKYMCDAGITEEELCTYPHGVTLPILMAIHECRELFELNLPDEALKLIGRLDYLRQSASDMGDWKDVALSPFTDPSLTSAWLPDNVCNEPTSNNMELDDRKILATILEPTENNEQVPKATPKMNLQSSADDNVTRLLFPNDHRMSEVWRLLQSEYPVRVDVTLQTGVNEHEFAEQCKARLLQICNRTMALAIGRGMAYLQTEKPVPTQSFEIPKMDLSGRCLRENAVVTLEGGTIEIPADMTDWPSFHSGVAAGLKIVPQMDDTSWIYLNKAPTTTNESGETGLDLTPEHAGFLLAVGLNGHIEKLHALKIHDYLTRTHEMTTVGLLLSLGASKCASCDLNTMRLLSVHVPAFLPPTSTDFDVPRIIQAAAVTAAGFLYLGSAQRFVAEVLLREIDRPPSPENDSGQYREAYALSCGIALGAVTLGRGGNIPELSDLNMPDKLYQYMVGKKKLYSEQSCQSIIMEGDQTNKDVTAPGAICALALMFLKTNNIAVSEWLSAPKTLLLLEAVRPQHLLLSTMANCLVMWDHVEPTLKWVQSHIPDAIRPDQPTVNFLNLASSASFADGETYLQCHASIMAGAALGLGLRFAGSQNALAYNTLHVIVDFFLAMWNDQSLGNESSSNPIEFMGKYTLESCLSTCLLALCMVVAGSGDMKALQICRFLHFKLGQDISYGVHMAIHMAIGFLFLGGCRKTLSTSNKAIAALVTSIYPCFPCSSTDNQYHLQALRHFYVLATERRLLVPIDSSTHQPCYAKVVFKYDPSVFGTDYAFKLTAPCMLPRRSELKEIAVKDTRHWPLAIDTRSQPVRLQQVLENGLSVQRRTGFQPYTQDPKGHRGSLALLSDWNEADAHWFTLLSNESFSTKSFTKMFLDSLNELKIDECATIESKNKTHLSSLMKMLIAQEKTRFLYAFYGMVEIVNQIRESKRPNTLAVWQLKIVRKERAFGSTSSDNSDINNGYVADLKLLMGLEPVSTMSTEQQMKSTQKQSLHKSSLFLPISNDAPLSGICTSTLWRLACFSIFNSVPSAFLLSTDQTDNSSVKTTESNKKRKFLEIVSSLKLRPEATAQLFQALFVS